MVTATDRPLGGMPRAATTKPAEDVFDGGPTQRLQRQLGFTVLARSYVGRRAALVAVVGWVPLAILSVLQTSSSRTSTSDSSSARS